MTEQDIRQMLLGEYVVAVQGLAMMRHVVTDTPRAKQRMAEIRAIAEKFDEFPNTLQYAIREYDVEDGYTRWAPSYDGPNPAIERETPIVRAMLEALPRGRALDAACGTGRHAATLTELGFDVIGVDTTPAMLDIARAKVPGAEFREGRLEALPLDDASVDIVTCALALTHVPDLAPVMREFARVLRPGGHAMLSDMHPFVVMTSGVAGFREDEGKRGLPFVKNIVHPHGEYVQAFLGAGLRVAGCVEPPVTEEQLPTFPTWQVYPDATRDAFLGLPYLLIWELERE